MKALLRTLLPGSAQNRTVDDMIDGKTTTNNNNNKEDVDPKKKNGRTKSFFSSSSSTLQTTHHHRAASQQQHHSNTTGCLERPDDSGLESSGDDDEYYQQHANNTQYPQGLNALSSSYNSSSAHPHYFNTNLSKQSSSSSVLSSSSNGDSALVVQTRSSPNVMQHSPRGREHNNSMMNNYNNNGNNNQQQPTPLLTPSNNNNNGNCSTPNQKRRSSLSNALRRLSLKKSGSANNHQQQHSDLSGIVGSPVLFADLMMSQSSTSNNNTSYSSSSIPINNNNNNMYNNHGGSFSSNNSILSNTNTSTTTTTNNNNSSQQHYLPNPDQILYTPNSPPMSPMSPLSFTHLIQQHQQQNYHDTTHHPTVLHQHALSSFTACTPNMAGMEQQTTPTNRRKSLNVITVGLSSHHNNPTTPTTASSTLSGTNHQQNQSTTIQGSNSNYCSPNYFEPHSPSMMLMMASQASPLLNNSSSQNNNQYHQQYYSVGGITPTIPSSSSTMGQAQRATGTQQLLDVFVNRRKWKDLLCVNPVTSNASTIIPTSSNNNGTATGELNKSNPSSISKSLDTTRASSPLSPELSIISTTSTEDEEEETEQSTISTYSPQIPQLPQHIGIENGDDFKLSNSPNENIFRAIVLGGFLSYKDVLKCDLVCRAWHLRISHSKENFIYFLPQLLSSISVWEEKDELQFMLATQIARNLSHLEISKRMLMVLFGLYRRSLHKEKIFNRAVFKEVLRSEVPDLLGLTDKANMFYKLTSPTWFSPYECFQCPIYLYLAKRSLRFVEKIDGEFQQRVQVLLKIKCNHEDTPSPSQGFFSVAGSGVNSVCASPTQSPNVTSTRKLSLATNSPLIRNSLDPRNMNDYSPDRPEPISSILNPPSSPLLNGNFSTSTSPSTKHIHQNTLADMVNEIKTCWFFAFGAIDKEQSDMQDRVYPSPSPPLNLQHQHVVTGHHHHHEKPILVHEQIVKFFSQFSLARMKNEVVFPEEEDCPSPIPFSTTKASDRSSKISSNIEHCYYEMTHFRNNPQGDYHNIKLAEPELCEQFNSTMSRWVCELQKLGLYQIEFIVQYVFKLLFFICTGPMYDRSELYFGAASLHDVLENDQLETVCTDPEASREKLQQWILNYRSKHSGCHIYHCYLKIKYECSGFTGGCDEESYLLTLTVSPDFSNFEFVSYLFESRYCKGQAISSLPLFIKKM